MRYQGGGVGHASTREATDSFLSDRHHEEIQEIHAIGDIPEVEVGVEAIDHDDEEEEAAELDYGYRMDEESASDEENNDEACENDEELDKELADFAEL